VPFFQKKDQTDGPDKKIIPPSPLDDLLGELAEFKGAVPEDDILTEIRNFKKELINAKS